MVQIVMTGGSVRRSVPARELVTLRISRSRPARLA